MSGIQISKGLLYKLAGVKDPNKQQKQQQVPQPSAPPQLKLPPLLRGELSHPFLADKESRQLLAQSKRVGGLLLKQEEQELQQIEQHAQELLDQQHKNPVRPEPCQGEKLACLTCYQEHAKDPLACAGLVQQYSACAKAVRGSLMQLHTT